MEAFNYIIADEQGFTNEVFDKLLSAGYYRMQHYMFTCNDTMLDDGEQLIPVFWLRTLVEQCRLSKSAKAIIQKSVHFSISVQPAAVDDSVEYLYRLYKNHVSFSISPTCADYLHHDLLPHPFHSMMVQVHDGGELIATGFFDEGAQSIAGIMNIYHPQYQQYSLGKLLMLQKLQYAMVHHKQYYYTGYISPQSARFDYKTFPDISAVEVLLPNIQQWIPYHAITKVYLNDYYTRYLQV